MRMCRSGDKFSLPALAINMISFVEIIVGFLLVIFSWKMITFRPNVWDVPQGSIVLMSKSR